MVPSFRIPEDFAEFEDHDFDRGRPFCLPDDFFALEDSIGSDRGFFFLVPELAESWESAEGPDNKDLLYIADDNSFLVGCFFLRRPGPSVFLLCFSVFLAWRLLAGLVRVVKLLVFCRCFLFLVSAAYRSAAMYSTLDQPRPNPPGSGLR